MPPYVSLIWFCNALNVLWCKPLAVSQISVTSSKLSCGYRVVLIATEQQPHRKKQ